MAPRNCELIGRWRIVEADIWDRDYLDLCGPAILTIGDDGRGEIAFGALQPRPFLSFSAGPHLDPTLASLIGFGGRAPLPHRRRPSLRLRPHGT